MNLYDHVIQRKQLLEKEKVILEKRIASAPAGDLYICKNGKYEKWFCSCRERGSSRAMRRYIRKKERAFAEKLAAKALQKIELSDAVQELEAIDAYLRKYNGPAKQLSKVKEGMLHYELFSGIRSEDSEIEKWRAAEYRHCPKKPEALVHQVSSSLYVRSKSEAMIASVLMRYGIPFRYECELVLGQIVLYPDFIILHPVTKKIIIWEHFGLMNSDNYTQTAMQKLRTYIENGYIPSNNLITTFETAAMPLSYACVESIVKYHFGIE